MTKVDFTPTFDGKKIAKGIETFAGIVQSAADLGHKLAASCIAHAVKHGDSTLADRLVEACGETVRKNALRSWLMANGPFSWDKEAKRFVKSEKKHDKLAAELKAEGESEFIQRIAAIKNGWDKTPEAEFGGFDLLKVLQSAVKKSATYKDETDPARKAKINIRGVQHLERAIEAIIAERGQTLQ